MDLCSPEADRLALLPPGASRPPSSLQAVLLSPLSPCFSLSSAGVGVQPLLRAATKGPQRKGSVSVGRVDELLTISASAHSLPFTSHVLIRNLTHASSPGQCLLCSGQLCCHEGPEARQEETMGTRASHELAAWRCLDWACVRWAPAISRALSPCLSVGALPALWGIFAPHPGLGTAAASQVPQVPLPQ